MKKRKIYYIPAIVIVGLTAIWLTAVAVYLRRPEPAKDPMITQQEPSAISVTTATVDHYLVRTHQNNIAIYEVYTNGYQSVSRILDVDVSQLRAQDKEAFERGLILHGREELASLVEDFTS